MGKILVLAEVRDNKIKNAGIESACTGYKFAKELNSEFELLIIGEKLDAAINELKNYGFANIIAVENDKLGNYSSSAYAKIVSEICKSRNADVLIMSATSLGKDLAPRVAARLEGGLASDCTEIKVTDGNIIATRPVYAGKAYIDMKITSPFKIFTLRPNVFLREKIESNGDKSEKISVDLQNSDFSSKVTDIVKNSEKLDVAEANIIVSGGRGMKGPEHFNLVESLAGVLNAAVGASRAVVDAGWRPHSEQVGQTGKTVAPNLYIACGISGAIQHLAGMSSSKCIVAINKDKDAPIFSIADYAIVADVFEILPALTEEFKKVLSN